MSGLIVESETVDGSGDDETTAGADAGECREEAETGAAIEAGDNGVDRDARGIGWAIAGLVVVALVLRLVDLGGRPLHHDESLDAWWSWRFTRGEYDAYDPIYHGPVRFYLTGAFYWLFGVGDTTVRLLPALAGTAMVAMPYWMRRQLGNVAAVAAAAFLALSPSFLYFSRFGREDATIAAIFLAIMVIAFSFFDRPKSWHPIAAFFLIGAGLAVKENTFMFLAVIGSFLLLAVAQQASAAHAGADRRALRLAVGLAPVCIIGAFFMDRTAWWLGIAVAVCVVTAALATRWRRGGDVRLATPLVGAELLFLLTAALGAGEPLFLWLGLWGGVIIAMLAAALVGWSNAVDREAVPMLDALASVGVVAWVAAAAVLAISLQVWFSVFGTGDTDIVDGLTDGIQYWRSQQDVNRGGQPWFYYLYLLPAYEWLAIGLASIGGWRVWRRPTLLGSFLVWSAVANLILYSYAGERMPWLILHPLLPVILLAALGVAELWDNRRRTVVVLVAAVAMLGAVVTTAWTMQTVYERSADPAELFSQAGQATPQLVATVDRVRALDAAIQRDLGRSAVVVIDTTQDGGWPYPWYFRDSGYRYVKLDTDELPTGADIVIINSRNLDRFEPALVGYSRSDIEHRWWWVPSPDYHAGWLSGWWRWLVDREPFSPTGSIDESVFVSAEVGSFEP